MLTLNVLNDICLYNIFIVFFSHRIHLVGKISDNLYVPSDLEKERNDRV